MISSKLQSLTYISHSPPLEKWCPDITTIQVYYTAPSTTCWHCTGNLKMTNSTIPLTLHGQFIRYTHLGPGRTPLWTHAAYAKSSLPSAWWNWDLSAVLDLVWNVVPAPLILAKLCTVSIKQSSLSPSQIHTPRQKRLTKAEWRWDLHWIAMESGHSFPDSALFKFICR